MRNPEALVRDGYDRASHAYPGDEFDDSECSGQACSLPRFTPGLPDGARVPDLECGCGIPVSPEPSLRCQVTGVDISPVWIARARQLVPRTRFMCADMARVEFKPRTLRRLVRDSVPGVIEIAVCSRLGGHSAGSKAAACSDENRRLHWCLVWQHEESVASPDWQHEPRCKYRGE